MRRIGVVLIVAVQLFLLQTVRLGERLVCVAGASAPGLTCRRRISRVVGSSDDTFAISDARSVAFHVSGHTSSGHVSMNTSSIDAVDVRGRTVVLLSIPANEAGSAGEIEQQLRNLERATPPRFVFERDQRRTLWLFLAVVCGWWLAYFGMVRFARRRASPHA